MSSNLTQEKVVCPHCWHKFHGDRASYISQHDELYGDPVLGDSEHRRFSYLEVRHDIDGNVVDPKGWSMTERACPNCHLQLPLGLLAGRPRFVSIVGAPGSGKTYFLTAMLHYLRRELSKYFNYTLEVGDYHGKSIFAKFARKLFSPEDPLEPTLLEKTTREGDMYNTITLDGAQVVLPKPFIFSLRQMDRSDKSKGAAPSNFVFYDNSGESFYFRADDDGNRRYTQHLGESSAVLFAYDLLLHPTARLKLKSISDDPQLAENTTSRQEDVLTETIQRIRKYRRIPSEDRLDITLVVCVQKYDVWNSLLPFGKEAIREYSPLDHSSIEYFKQHGVAGLDVQEMNAISLLVRKLLYDFSPSFVASAEANFKRVRYFPVSALGRSPSLEGDMLQIQPIQIQPFRVTHPMLWMLQEWGFIKRTKPSRENPRGYPVATIQRETSTRIHVLSPSSGSLLKLDAEYAGSSIIDPESGESIWIPSLRPSSPAQPTSTKEEKDSTPAETSSEATDLSDLGLKPTSAREPKKSWWSKWF